MMFYYKHTLIVRSGTYGFRATNRVVNNWYTEVLFESATFDDLFFGEVNLI